MLIHGKVRDLKALTLEMLASVEHRMMLDRTGYDMAPFARIRLGKALQSPVVSL